MSYNCLGLENQLVRDSRTISEVISVNRHLAQENQKRANRSPIGSVGKVC